MRTHRSLNKDAPLYRAIQRAGRIVSVPVLADFITNIAESSFRYRQGDEFALMCRHRKVPPCGSVRALYQLLESFYERLVGGSTWHWQGIHVRIVPNDFAMKTLYGKGVDWPLNYDDLERWYVEGEREMAVAGDNEERRDDLSGRRLQECPP